MSGSPSLIALTITIAMMVYLSFHHLALASRTGSGRIHLGIGLVGGASLVLALTRFVFYLAPTPEIPGPNKQLAVTGAQIQTQFYDDPLTLDITVDHGPRG